MTEMRVASLASGSKGNAYLVVQDGEALLIDCGICFSTLKARVAALMQGGGMEKPSLCGVLLTHSHSDHTSGLRPLLSRHDVPIYANYISRGIRKPSSSHSMRMKNMLSTWSTYWSR